MESEKQGPASPGRRRMIKTGAAVAGAAYVAPAIIGTSVASAQTTTCYNIKYADAGCAKPESVADGDSGCTDFKPVGGDNQGTAEAGHALVELISGSCGNSDSTAVLKVTCPEGSTVTEAAAAYKSGADKDTGCSDTTGVDIDIDGQTVTFSFDTADAHDGKDISHVSIGFCCATSS